MPWIICHNSYCFVFFSVPIILQLLPIDGVETLLHNLSSWSSSLNSHPEEVPKEIPIMSHLHQMLKQYINIYLLKYYCEILKCLYQRIRAPGIARCPIWSSVEVAFRSYFRSRISELQFLPFLPAEFQNWITWQSLTSLNHKPEEVWFGSEILKSWFSNHFLFWNQKSQIGSAQIIKYK